MENKENLVIIPADLPEGSRLSKAPNGRSVIMVPVTFELCEEAYRLLSVYAEAYSLPYETPDEVARWIVNGHCNAIRKVMPSTRVVKSITIPEVKDPSLFTRVPASKVVTIPEALVQSKEVSSDG